MSQAHRSPQSTTAERPVRTQPFGAPHIFVLAVVEGADLTRAFRLSRSESIVGRSEDCAIRIDDEQISKRHCKIRIEGGVCTLHDLESTNGTELNGRPFRRGTAHRLRHLDEIRLGGTRLVLLSGRYNP